MQLAADRLMSSLPRMIQGTILFSGLLGVFFLWLAYPLLPRDVFYILALGWGLFVIDGVLTFVRPRLSYYLGLILAVAALSETLAQPGHYALVESGNLPATMILVLGSVAQAFLIVSVTYYLISGRRKDPWSWPAAEVPAEQSDDAEDQV